MPTDYERVSAIFLGGPVPEVGVGQYRAVQPTPPKLTPMCNYVVPYAVRETNDVLTPGQWAEKQVSFLASRCGLTVAYINSLNGSQYAWQYWAPGKVVKLPYCICQWIQRGMPMTPEEFEKRFGSVVEQHFTGCGPGLVWNAALQKCVPVAPPAGAYAALYGTPDDSTLGQREALHALQPQLQPSQTVQPPRASPSQRAECPQYRWLVIVPGQPVHDQVMPDSVAFQILWQATKANPNAYGQRVDGSGNLVTVKLS